MLQCVAVCFEIILHQYQVRVLSCVLQCVAMCCNVLQCVVLCVAVCCRVLQYVAMCRSMFQDNLTSVPSQVTMGWLWLVSSLKLYNSFAKEPYKRDCILQTRPIILRSLLIVATQYRDILQIVTTSHVILTATHHELLKIIGLFCKRAL